MNVFSFLKYALSKECVAAPAPREYLTIATFNIRYYNHKNDFGKHHWFVRAKYCLRIIEEMQPDVLCLQEVHPPQYAYLKKHLVGYDSVIGYRENRGVHSEACPIFYNTARFTLLDSGTFWLSDTPEVMSKYEDAWHYRISTFVRLRDADGTVFTVFNVHPDYRIEQNRIRQLLVLADKVRHTEGPVFVTGDFNAAKGEKCLEPFEEMLIDSKDAAGVKFGATFNGFGVKPVEEIDYIYLPKDCTLVETNIVKTLYNGVYPSDHYPIYAKVSLKKE